MLVPAQSDVPFVFFCNLELQQPVVKAMTMAVVHPPDDDEAYEEVQIDARFIGVVDRTCFIGRWRFFPSIAGNACSE